MSYLTDKLDNFLSGNIDNKPLNKVLLIDGLNVFIRNFSANPAMDDNGELKEMYQQNKIAALNKAGHGMHIAPGPFQRYTQSAKVIDLLSELGWRDPCVPQSMYIFKQAKIGGEG